MKIRIIINGWVNDGSVDSQNMFEQKGHMERSEVWRGDIEIERDKTYVTKVSIIADGELHPICDIPFSLSEGHYMWIPPTIEMDSEPDYELDVAPNDTD